MKESVKTAIRWRADNANNDLIIKKINEQIVSVGVHSKTFCFEHVIENSGQLEVYDLLVKPLVEKALEGYGCTFLASGQTGSGKTYTLGFENSTDAENRGMTGRALDSIFACKNVERVKVSFVEVYNDQVFDLLAQKREPYRRKDHKLSDSIKKLVQNEVDALVLLSQGTKNRHVRVTNMNPTSSRSHAIFTIYLRVKQSGSAIRESVINLVDLAGSECVRKTGNTGVAHVEGKNINESLSAFKRVIMAMSNRASHIPFRDSVITTILRDTLKPDCYLTLLGCVSPHQRDYGETLSTVSFVAEAKLIKRTPQLNAIIDQLQKCKTPTVSLSTNQRKSAISSRPKSEPQISKTNMSSRKRYGRKLGSCSTPKKLRLSDNQNGGNCFAINRTKVASSLFPTATRCGITEFTDINWDEAITSSVLDLEVRKVNSPKKVTEPQTQSVERILENLLADKVHSVLKETKQIMKNRNVDIESMQKLMAEIMKKCFEQNPTMNASIRPTQNQYAMLSTVIENECTENALSKAGMSAGANAHTNKNDENLDKDSMKNQHVAISSNNESDFDLIPLHVSDKFDNIDENVVNQSDGKSSKNCNNLNQIDSEKSVSSDHIQVIDKSNDSKISSNLIEVNGKSHEGSINPSHFGVSREMEENAVISQERNDVNDLTSDAINLDNVELELIEESIRSDRIETNDELSENAIDHVNQNNLVEMENDSSVDEDCIMFDVTYTVHSIGGKKANGTEHGQSLHETDSSVDVDRNNSLMMQTPPSVIKHVTEQKVRTPIGKLVIRKVAHSNQFENTQYAVEVVPQYPMAQKVVGNMPAKAKRTMLPPGIDDDEPLVPDVVRPGTSISTCPKSLRINLPRISTLDDYQKYYGTTPTTPQQNAQQTVTCETYRTAPVRMEDNRRPLAATSKVSDTMRVLEILNTGSEKCIQKLATIGVKKASQIFNYRLARGQFRSLDGLLEMPFWSKKFHERFIMNNIFA